MSNKKFINKAPLTLARPLKGGDANDENAVTATKPQNPTTGFGAAISKTAQEPEYSKAAKSRETPVEKSTGVSSLPTQNQKIETRDQILTKNVQSFQTALLNALKNRKEQNNINLVKKTLNPQTALRILETKPHVVPDQENLEKEAIKEDKEKKPDAILPQPAKIKSEPIFIQVNNPQNDDAAVHAGRLKEAEEEAEEKKIDRLDFEHVSVHLKYTKDIELDASQKAALEGLRWQQFGCLIGPAGTGKTTVTKILVSILEETTPQIDLNSARVFVEEGTPPEYNVAIAFCAFTGRAVQQMKRALPEKYHPLCQTIHSLLGFAPVFYEDLNNKGELVQKMRFEPTFTATRKLPYKVIVMDESGMTPIALWNQLWDACHPDTRIIMIGDINQLPPVQGRSVLGFAMTKWPTYELKEIWRQKIKQPDGTFISAEANPITEAAWNVLIGKPPKSSLGRFDMAMLPDGSAAAFNQIIGLVGNLYKQGKFDPLTDAIIVPKNVGPLGQQALNERLVSFFNPPQRVGNEILNKPTIIQTGLGTVVYRLGDKVMLLQNDRERGLTNGMTGVIVDIKPNGLFQGNRVSVDPRQAHAPINIDLDELETHLENTFSLSNDKKKKKEEEEEKDANQRQASHIVTVRFGQADEETLKEIEKQKELIKKLREDEARGYYSYALKQKIADEENKLDKLQAKHATLAQEISVSTSGSFRKIALAYAFTCHKSQGGEYPTVIIVCHAADLKMLTREWLYTAITRARSRCILLYNRRGLSQALYIQKIKGQTTQQKIASFVRLQQEIKDLTVPNLPEARNLQPQNGGQKWQHSAEF